MPVLGSIGGNGYPKVDYPSWPINDFSGGINEATDKDMVKENECDSVQNCVCLTAGILEGREGQANLNNEPLPSAINGLHPFYLGSSRKLVVSAGGKVYWWNNGALTEIKAGLSATAPHMYETCVNYMVGTDGGAHAPWKWDGTNPVSALANAPATGRCPVLHKEKLFMIVDDDTIQWADSFQPETWPGVNEWNFDAGNGDKLTKIVRIGRELLAGKERQLHILQGSSLDDFRSDIVDHENGIVGPLAGVIAGEVPTFFGISYNGIMRFDGLRSAVLSEQKLKKTWKTVNKEYLHTAVAGKNSKHNQLWFHLPEGNSTVPNMVIVLDMNFGGWWIFRGITASCMIEFNTGATLEVYTGHTTLGNVVKQNQEDYADFGNSIECYYVGPSFDDGNPAKFKGIKRALVTDVDGYEKASYSYRLDGGSWLYPQRKTDIKGVRHFIMSNPRCREYQPRLSTNVSGTNFAVASMETLYSTGSKG